MSSVQYLREFIRERLTAAAEEIFGVFEKTIVEYEEEFDRQRRLLDIVWKPEIKLQRIELPQQHVCKEEEVLSDQQVCNQERDSSLDQEDPEPLQIKEEQEEICTSQEGEQLVLKQETDTLMFTLDYEENDHREPEPDGDQQLLSPVAESQDHRGSKHVDSEKRRHKNRTHNNNVHKSSMSKTHTGEKSLRCDTCGKSFKYNSLLTTHLKIHTGEKYSCKTCGKILKSKNGFLTHMKTHTGEKPHPCETCGKSYLWSSHLKDHIRTHTGERPYCCETCGKRFIRKAHLKGHIRTHTGEKPYSCETCGKCFVRSDLFKDHMRHHS